MLWAVVGALVSAFLLLRVGRRRRELIQVSPSEPISPMHLGLSKKRTGGTKAALDAASELLR
jgi:hypothetical protein